MWYAKLSDATPISEHISPEGSAMAVERLRAERTGLLLVTAASTT
jgi:hypothetical protein